MFLLSLVLAVTLNGKVSIIDKTIDNLPSQQTCSNLKEEMKMNFSTYEPNSNVVIVSSICVNKTTGVIE